MSITVNKPLCQSISMITENKKECSVMIVLKKHIAAVIIVLIAIIIAFLGIKKYESSQTFANDDFKVILDAGHDA